MNRWVMLAAAALLLLWGPFLYRELFREAPPEAPEPEDLLALPDVPRALPAALPAAAPEPEPAVEDEPEPEVEPEPAPEPEVEPEPEPEPEPAPEQTPVQEVVKPRAPARLPPASGPVEVLKGAFEEETRDALWAREAEGQLRSMGQEHGFELSDRQVSCRRTVCRLEVPVNLDDTQPFLDYYVTIGAGINKHLALQPEGLDNDSPRVFLYVPRSGYELSDFTE